MLPTAKTSRTSLLQLFLLIIFLPGCYLRQAYYVSPFNGNNDHYHTMPLKSDSIKSATYVGGSFYSGAANTGGRDGVFAFQGDVSRSQQFGIFQAYYGGDFSIGNYKVASYQDGVDLDNTVNYKLINQFAGNKFFGGWGLSGGINFVLPGGNGGEWRAFGIEASTHNELGDYSTFRNELPDSAATLIVRNNSFSTYGIYTEIMGKAWQGSYGIKLSTGDIIESQYHHLNIYDNSDNHLLQYSYFNMTFHYTYDKWTGYLQGGFATKASGVKLGLNYRLGRKHLK